MKPHAIAASTLSLAIAAGAAGAGGAAGPALAGEVVIEDARAVRAGDGTWTFHVTLSHADEGWDHYADQWQVVAPDGEVLATRELLHPHDNEQPFTRSLSGVGIAQGTASVTIRARDSVHGTGPETFEIALPR